MSPLLNIMNVSLRTVCQIVVPYEQPELKNYELNFAVDRFAL